MATFSCGLLSFLCCLYAIMLTCQTVVLPGFEDSICSNEGGNYTTNSTYHKNLNTVLSTLTSNTQIDYGFYNFSYGQNPDKVYAIGLCRGDVKQEECHNCLNNSRISLTQDCPNYKEAIIWKEQCMLRYSIRSIFGTMEPYPPGYIYTTSKYNVTDEDDFYKVLGDLLRKLRDKAASGDTRRKYATATDTAIVAKLQITIYGLVQCTPDLSRQDCEECLHWTIIANIPKYFKPARYFKGKVGGAVLRPSCYIRFEIYPFYDAAVPSSSPQGKEKGNSLRTTIAIVVPTILLAVVLLFFVTRYFRRKATKSLLAEKDQQNDEIKMVEFDQFDLDTIQVATSNFSDSNKLGVGGFGTVFQGKLPNGQVIAVKRLSSNSAQGDLEFKNEVLLLAKLQHRNLVRLLGFCLEGKEKLLVYEFVPNKSLDYFIFDPAKKAQLDWDRRYKIIRGIARGLLYLHEDSRLRIIHRDLKASNVLLDEDMIPKISDFGMARLIVADQTQENTNRIVGTYGYMAPEYAMHGQFSVKSDVFSYGVLVLEIVSGQKNHGIQHENGEDLLNLAWRNWQEGTVTNIIDPSLNNYSQNEMIRCIHIGLLCVEENLANRPTMANITLMLNSYFITLPMPSKPAFFIHSTATTSLPNMSTSSWDVNSGPTRSIQSTTKSVHESINEDSITELYPR